MLAGGANRRDLIIGPESRFERRFRDVARRSAKVFGRLEPDPPVINDQRRALTPVHDHDRVATASLAGNREAAAGQRVVDPVRQRALADDGKFRRRGEGTADQRTEDERKRRISRERINTGAALREQEPRTQPASPEELSQHGFRQRDTFGAAE